MQTSLGIILVGKHYHSYGIFLRLAACPVELDDGSDVLALAPRHHDHAIGEMIGIRIEVDHLIGLYGA